MLLEVKVPPVGESITEGLLVEWLKRDGETVLADDHLFVLETDKVTMTVDAPGAGRLKILVPAGETVKVGQAVGAVDTAAAGAGEAVAVRPAPIPLAPQAPSPPPHPPAGPPQAASRVEAMSADGSLSPAVRRMVEEFRLDASAIRGTGKDGRITKEDVAALLKERAHEPTSPGAHEKEGAHEPTSPGAHEKEGAQEPTSPGAHEKEGAQEPTSPGAHEKEGARERESAGAGEKEGTGEGKGIDMGPGALGQSWGQFAQTQQFMQSLKEGRALGAPPAPAAPSMPAAPPAAPDGAESRTRTPLSPLRQRIAERMILSQQSTATLTTFAEVDMGEVVALRERFKEAFKAKHGVSLGFMSFFVKAAVEGLAAVPALMSMIEGGDLVQSRAFDVGIAVSTERGLVVPVLRDADKPGFAEVERRVAELAKRARARTITLAELEGGVFTITNAGSYGALFGTPILNPPQSGILGTYAIKERPVALGGQVVVRPVMMLALSYDHRVVDGEAAGRFLQRVAAVLEHPAALLLEI